MKEDMARQDQDVFKQVAAVATWLVISILEKNIDYYNDHPWDAEQAHSYLNQSLDLAEQQKHEESLVPLKIFLKKVLLENVSLIKNHVELCEAIKYLESFDEKLKFNN